jgi:zinc protease
VVSQRNLAEIGVTEWTLSNGVRVVLKPTDFKADEIQLSAFSPGGTSLASDADAFVLENAVIAVSVGGVSQFDQVALEKRLAGKAAGVSPYLSRLDEGISGFAAPADVQTMFELVYLYFTSPRRDSGAFEAFRTQARSMLQHTGADPSQAFADTITRVLSNYHPRIRLENAAMIDSLDLDRSLAFYRDRFSDASDFTFLLVGISTSTAFGLTLSSTSAGSLPQADRKVGATMVCGHPREL